MCMYTYLILHRMAQSIVMMNEKIIPVKSILPKYVAAELEVGQAVRVKWGEEHGREYLVALSGKLQHINVHVHVRDQGYAYV